MALIRYDTSSGNSYALAGLDTFQAMTWTHSGDVGPNSCVLVMAAEVAPAGGGADSITATYAGISMTTTTDVVSWGTGFPRFSLFYLLSPPTGNQTVVVTYSGMGVTAANKQLTAAASTYDNVSSVAGITTSVGVNSTSSIRTTTLSVPTDYAVFAHVKGSSSLFASYSLTERFTICETNYGRLLTGDTTETTGTITSTATISSPEDWIAGGFKLRRFGQQEFFA